MCHEDCNDNAHYAESLINSCSLIGGIDKGGWNWDVQCKICNIHPISFSVIGRKILLTFWNLYWRMAEKRRERENEVQF